MGEEEAPREKKKYLDVKSNTILTRFEFLRNYAEFLRNYAEFLRNIARVLVGFNHQIFVLDFCVLFFTHR